MTDVIGWVATAVFASSYFCRQTSSLRRTQALAALLWLVYGVLMKAPPVIVANLIVATLALLSSVRKDSPAPTEAALGAEAPPADGASIESVTRTPVTVGNGQGRSGREPADGLHPDRIQTAAFPTTDAGLARTLL